MAFQQLRIGVFILFVAAPLSNAQCNNDAFRLLPIPLGEINEGMVQRCVSQSWRAVCGTSWDCNDAKALCRQLGFPASNVLARTLSFSIINWSPKDTTRYLCSGNENSLNNCPTSTSSCSLSSAARALCQVENLCSQGDLRLTSGDADGGTGRLELCYGGKWNHFCTLGYNEAATACRQLGFSEYPRIITDGRYGRSNSSYLLFNGVTCSVHGNESSLTECTLSGTSGCTYTSTAAIPCTQVGLQCFRPPAQPCSEGAVRLVNGTIEQDGRVEVCIGGIWGSMCYSTWNTPNSFVVCNQLGHRSSSNLMSPAQTVSQFGAGSGPVFRGFRCEGWEQNIGQCYNRTIQYSPLSSASCNWNDIVGVRCLDSCGYNGNVRLIGGPNKRSGIVQVCYNSLWGLVAEPGWIDANAAVVCRQLRFSDEGAVVVNVDSVGFRKPKKAIHWSNVHCQGHESSLSQCTSYKHTLNVGIELMDKLEVAGVSCQPDVPTIDKVLMTNISNTVFTVFILALLLAILLIVIGLIVVYYCRNKQSEPPKTISPSVVRKQAGKEIYSEDLYETPAGINM